MVSFLCDFHATLVRLSRDTCATFMRHLCDFGETFLRRRRDFAQSFLWYPSFAGRKSRKDGVSENHKNSIRVGEYLNKSPKERVYTLFEKYDTFSLWRNAYKESVVDYLVDVQECKRRRNAEGLGVRIQTSGTKASVVEAEAEERLSLEQCFEKKFISRDVLPDAYDRNYISVAVYEWEMMKWEFGVLRMFIDRMKREDRALFVPYMRKETNLDIIADQLCIERQSANKRVYRIRKALLTEILPWFEEYKIEIPA